MTLEGWGMRFHPCSAKLYPRGITSNHSPIIFVYGVMMSDATGIK